MEWNRANTIKLIHLYQTHSELWDGTFQTSKNPDARQDALNDIAKEFRCDVSCVERKITNVRSQYFRELNKLKKGGSSESGIYTPSWYGFEMLGFLNPSAETTNYNKTLNTTTALNNVDESNSHKSNYPKTTEQQALRLSSEQPKDSSSNGKKQKTLHDHIDKHRNYVSRDDSPRNDYSHFTAHIASKLRSYNRHVASQAEFKISQILYEADMGYFDAPEITCTNVVARDRQISESNADELNSNSGTITISANTSLYHDDKVHIAELLNEENDNRHH